MKLKFSYIAYTVIAIALVIGVSRAYALTAPRSTPPTQSEISAPINNSGEAQTKIGSLITKNDLGATSPVNCGNIRILAWYDVFPENSGQDVSATQSNAVTPCAQGGGAVTSSFMVSPWAFFTQAISSSVIVGDNSTQSGDLPTVSEPAGSDPTSMKLDLVGRGTANNSRAGTQAISILAGNMCSTYTTINVDQTQIAFNSSVNSGKADVLARQVRLTAGNPQPNSVLIQGSGSSKWATLTVVNDQIVLTPN